MKNKVAASSVNRSPKIVPFILLSLTLGLMPFVPEPHLFGKIRWVAGGAVGMQPMDWFDLLLHGAPWLGLIYVLLAAAKKKFF